jgi:hypothetical protein
VRRAFSLFSLFSRRRHEGDTDFSLSNSLPLRNTQRWTLSPSTAAGYRRSSKCSTNPSRKSRTVRLPFLPSVCLFSPFPHLLTVSAFSRRQQRLTTFAFGERSTRIARRCCKRWRRAWRRVVEEEEGEKRSRRRLISSVGAADGVTRSSYAVWACCESRHTKGKSLVVAFPLLFLLIAFPSLSISISTPAPL